MADTQTVRRYCIADTHAVNTSKSTVKHADDSTSMGTHPDGYQVTGFLAFEAHGLPDGAVIEKVVLGGRVYSRYTSSAFSFTAKPAGGSWAESTLTYGNMPTSGGPSSTVSLADTGDTFTANITATAKGWFGGGYDYGCGLYLQCTTARSYKRLYSRTAAAASKPYIDITYHVPVSVPTLSASALSIAAGQALLVYTNRHSATYTHALSWSVGGASGAIATGVETSAQWTLSAADAAAMLAQLSAATSGTCVISCATYGADGALVGTQTVSLAVTVPEAVVPVISGVTVMGAGMLSGYYLQNRSTAAVAIAAVAGAGAAIASYSTKLDGVLYSGANPVLQLPASGARTIAVTVTDSRGRTAARDVTISVQAYEAPKVTAFAAWRADADGNAAVDGANLRFNLAASASLIGTSATNKLTAVISTKLAANTAYTARNTYAGTGNALSYANAIINGAPYDALSAYSVRLTLTDTAGSSVEVDIKIPTKTVLVNYDPMNERVTFGNIPQRSDPSGVVFYSDAYFRGGVSSDSGFAGDLNGTAKLAERAARLSGARSVRVNLGSADAAAFDGTADITPGVAGLLPPGNGGTGAADVAGARANFGFANEVVTITGTTSVPSGATAEDTVYTYTVPQSGIYLFVYTCNYAGNSTGRRTAIVKINGVEDIGSRVLLVPSASDTTGVQTSLLRGFVKGDALTFRAYQNSGTALSVQWYIRIFQLG